MAYFKKWSCICLSLVLVSMSHANTATDSTTQTFNTVFNHWGSPRELASWSGSSGITACNMTGVTCNSHAEVESLSLTDSFTGVLDPLLCRVTSLSSIAMVNSNLVGPIPPQISELIYLQILRLSKNALTGSLPASMSLLVRMTALEVDSNTLIGSVPQQLSTLVLLSRLQVSHNKLIGSLPSSLSSLKALVHFFASSNKFTGTLPAQYSDLQQLAILSLSSNSLTGTIPVQLTTNANLSLSVSENIDMCGMALTFGLQEDTNIGSECVEPWRKVIMHGKEKAVFWGVMTIAFVGFPLVLVAMGLCIFCPSSLQVASRTLADVSAAGDANV